MSKLSTAARVLVVILALGVVGGAIGVAFAAAGMVTISARPPHSGLTKFALHNTFKASVRRKAAGISDPPDLTDPGLIALGAQHYSNVCASCHGGPGLGQSPQAMGMRPSPQNLPAVVDQYDNKELFVILRDGVRFSAMAAWPADSNFGEIWALVAFLRQLPDMAPDTFFAMTYGARPTARSVPEMPWKERGPLEPYDIHIHPQPADEYLTASPGTGWRPLGLDAAPVARCAACHGLDGTGSPTGGHAPNIAIHDKAFIAKRLHDYATGRMPSGIMAIIASGLSSSQIDAVAEYYAGRAADGETSSPAALSQSADVSAGEAIVTAGLPDAAIPACGQCHSSDARTAMPIIPALAGQNANFLHARLESFAISPLNPAMGWNPMHAFAARLDDSERAAVADYLASLPADDPLDAPPVAVAQDMSRSAVSQPCALCHESAMNGGDDGVAPNLTLQTPEYLLQQLNLFRLGLRSSRIMTPEAHRVDEAALAELSAWIGAMNPVASSKTGPADGVTEEQLARADRIAHEGLPEANVPACLSCHGEKTTNGVGMIPRLNGQSAEYLKNRLRQFGEPGAEQRQLISPMTTYAEHLSDLDREALASYFAAQQPLKSTAVAPEASTAGADD